MINGTDSELPEVAHVTLPSGEAVSRSHGTETRDMLRGKCIGCGCELAYTRASYRQEADEVVDGLAFTSDGGFASRVFQGSHRKERFIQVLVCDQCLSNYEVMKHGLYERRPSVVSTRRITH